MNESLGQSVNIKIGDKTIEEKIPLEHKFLMTPLGSQAVYILKQSEEQAKGLTETFLSKLNWVKVFQLNSILLLRKSFHNWQSYAKSWMHAGSERY